MDNITTESTPIAGDAGALPTLAHQRDRDEQAVRGKCPACGFGTYQSHRFCRRCGINLAPWQNSTTVLPDENSGVPNDKSECLVKNQKLTTTRLVTGRNMKVSEHRFDLVIIGSGPAGQKGA